MATQCGLFPSIFMPDEFESDTVRTGLIDSCTSPRPNLKVGTCAHTPHGQVSAATVIRAEEI